MWIRLLDKLLVQFVKKGQLRVEYPNGTIIDYGQRLDTKIQVKINSSRILRRLFVNPDLTIGEAYMDGDLGIENNDNKYAEDFLDTVEMTVQAGVSAGAVQQKNLMEFL